MKKIFLLLAALSLILIGVSAAEEYTVLPSYATLTEVLPTEGGTDENDDIYQIYDNIAPSDFEGFKTLAVEPLILTEDAAFTNGNCCAQYDESAQTLTLIYAPYSLPKDILETENLILYLDLTDAGCERSDLIALQNAMLADETLTVGAKGDAARGLQGLLVLFGQGISVDGQAGKKTFAALNETQRLLGMEVGDCFESETYERLVTCIFANQYEQSKAVLVDYGTLSEDEYYYDCGCAAQATGELYSARKYFALSNLGDTADRAAACMTSWPDTEEIYHNAAYTDRSVKLNLVAESMEDGKAMVVKIYERSTLVSVVFFSEADKVRIRLPAGSYTARVGIGTEWFGIEEAFGEGGLYYRVQLDEDGKTAMNMTSGSYTLKINAGEDATGSPAIEPSGF